MDSLKIAPDAGDDPVRTRDDERHSTGAFWSLVDPAGRMAKRLAAPGYLAKGVLYVLVGGMAVHAALRPGEGLQGAAEAIRTVRTQPLGLIGAGLLLLGLACYVVWQLARAIADPDDRAEGIRGLGFRAVTLTVAGVYGALVWKSLGLLTGDLSRSEADSTALWLGKVLEQPGGRTAVVGIGAGVVLFGVSQLYRSLHPRTYAGAQHPWLAGVGYAARGVLSALIGWFFIQGGLHLAPREFRTLDEVLAGVRDQPYGRGLLLALAVGIIAYGGVQLFRARSWWKHGSG